jgi:LCP family protein required for cell wall assembly
MADPRSPDRTAAAAAGQDPWGPTVAGGSRHRLLRHLLATLLIGSLVATAAIATTGALLLQQGDAHLTRVPVAGLDQPQAAPGEVDGQEPTAAPRASARHFLVVGSDSREGLDDQELRDLRLGDFGGQRSDTMLYVAISEDREQVSLVSLPRDLLVVDGGENRKLTDTFADGPGELVRVIRQSIGLPVNHYAHVSIVGFLEVVRTLGTVRVCLEDPLRDPKSGADFSAGCHDMDEVEALSYVRSRRGARGDFDRIDRQQTFVKAVLDELTAARVLVDPRRLFRLVEDVASNVTTDDQLRMTTALSLADELRSVVGGGVPMTTVPGYPRTIDGVYYIVPYGPGARALFEDLRAGNPLPDRGTVEEREETEVVVFSGGRDGTEAVRATLELAGFAAFSEGRGPERLDAGATTTVYATRGNEEAAGFVAAVLRAPVRPLPPGVELPGEATVAVAVGDDATT